MLAVVLFIRLIFCTDLNRKKTKLLIIMKTTFWILFTVFCLIYSSKPTIAFKPFSIEFGSPYTPFGIIFLILALSCFNLQTRKDTKKEVFKDYYVEGLKDGFDNAIKSINKELKNQGKDAQISVKSDVE